MAKALGARISRRHGVRKKLKLPLLSEKIDGVRTYRIGTAKAAKTKKTSAARKA